MNIIKKNVSYYLGLFLAAVLQMFKQNEIKERKYWSSYVQWRNILY